MIREKHDKKEMPAAVSLHEKLRQDTNAEGCSCNASKLTERSDEIDDCDAAAERDLKEGGVWYFGYGPIVHPDVRERRKVKIAGELQAAVLPDHQLTFCYGGFASLIPRRGFSVQGVLMKVASEEDWQRLKDFDSGYYVQQVLNVYPYDMKNLRRHDVEDSEDEEDEECDDPLQCYRNSPPVRAYSFVMTEYEESILEKPIEKKPQERYLRLIARGMERHGVDPTYVQDEIMACPYIPNIPPEDWHEFPKAKESLRTIRYQKYLRMCKTAPPTVIYFIMDDYVLKMTVPEANLADNPVWQWTKRHCHGQPDNTFLLHSIGVDPDIPFAWSPAELTPLHYAWAENYMYISLEQAGLSATKIFRVTTEDDLGDEGDGVGGGGQGSTNGQGGPKNWRRSLRNSIWQLSISKGNPSS